MQLSSSYKKLCVLSQMWWEKAIPKGRRPTLVSWQGLYRNHHPYNYIHFARILFVGWIVSVGEILTSRLERRSAELRLKGEGFCNGWRPYSWPIKQRRRNHLEHSRSRRNDGLFGSICIWLKEPRQLVTIHTNSSLYRCDKNATSNDSGYLKWIGGLWEAYWENKKALLLASKRANCGYDVGRVLLQDHHLSGLCVVTRL